MGIFHQLGQAVKLLWLSGQKSQNAVGSLPVPAGPHKVGTTRLTLTDKARTGIYCDPGMARRLPVQIWYPAAPVNDTHAPFLPAKGTMKLFAKAAGLPNLFSGLDAVNSNAYLDAPADPAAKGAPLLIFSHGYSSFECQNTAQMEHLASHGYVVASICHTYEAFAACTDDGSVVPINMAHHKAFLKAQRDSIPKGADLSDPETLKYAMNHNDMAHAGVAVWVDDTVFVADRLAAMAADKKDRFHGAFKTDAIGLFGHSYGGATSGDATLRDKRFTCFCNMDGGPYGLLYKQGTAAPGMLLTSETHIEAAYHADNKNLLVVRVARAKHSDYTDYGTLVPVLKKVDLVLGDIPAADIERIMNDYLLSFFNTFLRGQKPDARMKMQAADPYTEVFCREDWAFAR